MKVGGEAKGTGVLLGMTVLFRLPLYYVEPQESEPVFERPKTRADCERGGFNEARPCPFVSCRYHLFEEFAGATSEEDLLIMPYTCVLDVADEGGLTLEAVGDVLGVSRQRIEQIEGVALRKLSRKPELRR